MGAAPLTTDSIGSALRALRDASGLTGDAVARRASMSAGKLSKIENGRTLPTVQDVVRSLSAAHAGAQPFACHAARAVGQPLDNGRKATAKGGGV
ncbi:helix-turn-helix domain-containing protein [Streptomyces sp. NBC_00996]|uniref:helix-turn-helix domain-containing protein n=1 Tax=Streptomyces sp. NBC_00996 TaxID=2903710 RepID=UPI0038643132